MNWPVVKKPEHVGGDTAVPSEEKANGTNEGDDVNVDDSDWRKQYYGINF
jgi:hypothetical protein